MNNADKITVFRALLVFPIAYLILVKFNPIPTLLLIGVMFVLDALDGFAMVSEKSNGSVTIIDYISASVFGLASAKRKVNRYKSLPGTSYGARLDIAGDRIIEYSFWIIFTYLHIIPLAILLLIVVRHSFVDALMGSKGTSSKMRSRFGYWVYSSNIGRGWINVTKAVAFGYLALIYATSHVYGAYLLVGYVLVAVLFVYIMLRGIAQVYDFTRK